MINWWGWINIMYCSPVWFLIIILQQIFFVLLVFKVYSGNWIGRETKKEKTKELIGPEEYKYQIIMAKEYYRKIEEKK